jgi:hypothetical protein
LVGNLAMAANPLSGFVIKRSAEYGQNEAHTLRCGKSISGNGTCELIYSVEGMEIRKASVPRQKAQKWVESLVETSDLKKAPERSKGLSWKIEFENGLPIQGEISESTDPKKINSNLLSAFLSLETYCKAAIGENR